MSAAPATTIGGPETALNIHLKTGLLKVQWSPLFAQPHKDLYTRDLRRHRRLADDYVRTRNINELVLASIQKW
jgi:hypothetical protein